MKVRTYVLATSTTILLFLSAGSEKTNLSKGYHPGDLAPELGSLGMSHSIRYDGHPGKYTLLSFWAAYDAESHAKNVSLWNKVRKLDSTRITMYSISMDERNSVFTETIKMDKLDLPNQFSANQSQKSSLYKAFGLRKKLTNFLIDDQGVIVATDVDRRKLSELIN